MAELLDHSRRAVCESISIHLCRWASTTYRICSAAGLRPRLRARDTPGAQQLGMVYYRQCLREAT